MLRTTRQAAAARKTGQRLLPGFGTWHIIAAVANLLLNRLDQAVNRLRKSIELCSTEGIAHFYLAAALALLGRNEDAASACADGSHLIPNFTITKLRSEPFSDNPVYLAQRERIYEGLRKAGVPE